MNRIMFVIFMCMPFIVFGQKYFTKTGQTEFKASVEAFEPVEAKNNSTTAILNMASGEVAALLFVKAFHFKVALMEEHFNENYMDSDKYPKATFKGAIEGFDPKKIEEEEVEMPLNGILTIREKAKEVNTAVKLKRVKTEIWVSTEFEVSPEDFDIEIPGIVSKKIAESIRIISNYQLNEKK